MSRDPLTRIWARANSQGEVDSQLPLGLSPFDTAARRWGRDESLFLEQIPARPSVKSYKLGGTIVNSVTIHRMSGHGDPVKDEDVVVVRYSKQKSGVDHIKLTFVIS